MGKKNKSQNQTNTPNPSEQKSQKTNPSTQNADEETTEEILNRIERIEKGTQGGKKKNQKSVPQPQKPSPSKGPSVFSLYFIVPQILVVLINIAADHFAAPYLQEGMRRTFGSDGHLAGLPPVRVDLTYDAMLFHSWVWIVFVTAVLKCARGNVIFGFVIIACTYLHNRLVYGVVISSALSANWMIEPFLHGAPIEFLTAYLNCLYVISKGAILGEIAVIVASFFIPQQKTKQD